MLQLTKKLFSIKGVSRKSSKKIRGKNNLWAERQIREMAKLGGKLILM